jgi:hypothetical protein
MAIAAPSLRSLSCLLLALVASPTLAVRAQEPTPAAGTELCGHKIGLPSAGWKASATKSGLAAPWQTLAPIEHEGGTRLEVAILPKQNAGSFDAKSTVADVLADAPRKVLSTYERPFPTQHGAGRQFELSTKRGDVESWLLARWTPLADGSLLLVRVADDCEGMEIERKSMFARQALEEVRIDDQPIEWKGGDEAHLRTGALAISLQPPTGWPELRLATFGGLIWAAPEGQDEVIVSVYPETFTTTEDVASTVEIALRYQGDRVRLLSKGAVAGTPDCYELVVAQSVRVEPDWTRRLLYARGKRIVSVFFKFAVPQVGDGPSEAQKKRMDDLLASLRIEAIENDGGKKPAQPAPQKKPEPQQKPAKPEKPKKPAGAK